MKYSVTKEQIIAGSTADILKNIANFNNWSTWSPWACLDPQTITNCRDDYLAWESRFTGTGNMQRIAQTDASVEISLQFVKPFKSKAHAIFKLEPISSSTIKVIWTMESRLPLFLIFFKKLFQAMISNDFKRGLTRLKYLVETGKVPCRIEYVDEPQSIEAFTATGISTSCTAENIGKSMHTTFEKLGELMIESGITPIKMVALYDKTDLVKAKFDYTAAAIHDGVAINKPGLNTRNVPAHKAIKVILHGNYEFMSDAWSGIYTHLRGLKLKADKFVVPYDVYIKGPMDTENPNDYVTEIYLPVKVTSH